MGRTEALHIPADCFYLLYSMLQKGCKSDAFVPANQREPQFQAESARTTTPTIPCLATLRRDRFMLGEQNWSAPLPTGSGKRKLGKGRTRRPRSHLSPFAALPPPFPFGGIFTGSSCFSTARGESLAYDVTARDWDKQALHGATVLGDACRQNFTKKTFSAPEIVSCPHWFRKAFIIQIFQWSIPHYRAIFFSSPSRALLLFHFRSGTLRGYFLKYFPKLLRNGTYVRS